MAVATKKGETFDFSLKLLFRQADVLVAQPKNK